MRNSKKLFGRIVCTLIAVLFMSVCTTFAGTFTYDLSGYLDIWQLTGTVCTDSSTGCDLTYTLTQDSAGKITGSGDIDCTADYGDGDVWDLNGTYAITGTITQTKGIATVKMKIKISVLADNGTDPVERWKGTETVTATIDTISNTIEGKSKLGETFDYTQDLPDDMNGSAFLAMTVNPTNAKGTKLGGTGTLTLSNGDLYNYIIKGSYNAKKALDSLTLTGTGKPSPCKFTLVINDDSGNLKSLKGKSLGQTLAASNIPAE